jgi:hypothetical protein
VHRPSAVDRHQHMEPTVKVSIHLYIVKFKRKCRNVLLSHFSLSLCIFKCWYSCFHATWYKKITNKIQLCGIIYYSLAALHVSSDIFTHHQENLNCITDSGITHVCRCQLAATYVCNTRSCNTANSPNNISKWQMWFNSAFKGLMSGILFGPRDQPASYSPCPEALFPRLKRAGREAERLPPYSSEFKNQWICTCTHAQVRLRRSRGQL